MSFSALRNSLNDGTNRLTSGKSPEARQRRNCFNNLNTTATFRTFVDQFSKFFVISKARKFDAFSTTGSFSSKANISSVVNTSASSTSPKMTFFGHESIPRRRKSGPLWNRSHFGSSGSNPRLQSSAGFNSVGQYRTSSMGVMERNFDFRFWTKDLNRMFEFRNWLRTHVESIQ